jgi:hypothetical protein
VTGGGVATGARLVATTGARPASATRSGLECRVVVPIYGKVNPIYERGAGHDRTGRRTVP